MADLSPQYIAPNLAQPAEVPTTMSNELMAPTVPIDNQLTTNLNQFTQNVGVAQPTEGQLSKQMTALNLASSMPNLFLGMHTGLANKVNQRIEEGMITNYAMNGVTPYDAIQTELDKFEANQNAVNTGAQELTSLDEQLKAKMKENQDLQKLMMDSMLQKSDASGILAAQQRIADLQTKAPTAPDLQVPELKEADQALIFLAGLIGGNQSVPQAIQGAIAGAKQRTEMANQLAAQKFNQEQQAFNKQASIEQALLQRETTKYNIDATNLRNVQDNYREISNIQQRAINLLTAKKADVKAKQLATISQSYKKLIDQAKTENEITEEHQKAIEALQKAAIAIGEDPNMFPKFDTIGLTAKGQAFEEKKKIDRIEADIARADNAIAVAKRNEERALEASVAAKGFALPETSERNASDVLRQIAATRSAHTFTKEERTLVPSTNTVPKSFFDEVFDVARLVGPMLDVGQRINTTSGEDITIPTLTAYSTATLKAAGSAIDESEPTYSSITLGAYKYGLLIPVANELITDAGFNISAHLAEQAGNGLGFAVNAALTTGDGNNKPNGVVTAAGSGITGGTGVAGAFTADNLIDLQYSLDGAARRLPGVAYMATGSSIGAMRKLKEWIFDFY